ncbi:hypothetical protein BT96DRAFT_669736 [Gymnopus androsaceus JB14]|uniref:Uncharacterized protein n=1 Tax=Gymnopus androsaceus JB14 TaxID=1447944 RepID=A0A6A4IJI3_9AGAR|nr:hypothetical protein BT96DRAFT_669736 [Gymnopus androsaceus JB14]
MKQLFKIPLLDIIHRSVVYSLAGLTAWTAFSALMIHRETLQKGRGKSLLVWKLEERQKAEHLLKSTGSASPSS